MRRPLVSALVPALGIAVAGLSTGCLRGPYNAPYGATVSFGTEAIVVSNSPTFWYLDGIGAAFPVGVFVAGPDRYEDVYGLANTKVEIYGPNQGVYLLPRGAVRAVRFPDAGGSESQIDDICIDDNGNVNNSGENEWCGWYYDESAQSYVQLDSSYASAAGYTEDGEAYGPNYVNGVTNRHGLVELWVFIDALPTSGEGFPTNDESGDDDDDSTDSGQTTTAAPPPADTGDTGAGTGGDDGSDGGGGEDESTELEEVAIWASIGHNSASLIISAEQQ